jgi:hypothetical protein
MSSGLASRLLTTPHRPTASPTRIACAHAPIFRPVRAAILVAAALGLSGFSVGCASPGPPRPPSLKLPKPVADLTAQRVGNQVILHWTSPSKTTDDLEIKGTIAARICREIGSSSLHLRSKTPCAPVLQIPVQPGASTATDQLQPPFNSDPPALLTYFVEIDNVSGHSAGPSNQAFTATGRAPDPIVDLRATPVRSGAMLEWRQPSQAATAAETVELLRTQLHPATTPPSDSKKPPAAAPSSLSSPAPTIVRLRVAGESPQPPAHPDGTIDRTVRTDDTYTYTAERIRTVQLGVHTLQLRSPVSAAITFTMRDLFPPAIPTGLDAILGSAITPGDPTPHPTIDLSWEPDTDTDLAGYILYRQPLTTAGEAAVSFIRLNPAPLPGPSFRDLTAVPGQPYAYRVTAIDQSGNESSPSRSIQETIPRP